MANGSLRVCNRFAYKEIFVNVSELLIGVLFYHFGIGLAIIKAQLSTTLLL